MTVDDDNREPSAVVADTAALAANSAERAQAAAADAIANAPAAAATVAQQSAEQIAETQEGLDQWRTTIQTRQEELAAGLQAQSQATEAKLAEIMDKLSSIPSRPEPKPGSPANPDPGSNEPEAPPEEAPPPPEPSPPRKKAHRWI